MARGNKKGNLTTISTITHLLRKGNTKREREIYRPCPNPAKPHLWWACRIEAEDTIGRRKEYISYRTDQKLLRSTTGHYVQNIRIMEVLVSLRRCIYYDIKPYIFVTTYGYSSFVLLPLPTTVGNV